MQSIYWVLTWACHRKCRHCYDDRFRPYVRGALDDVIEEGASAYARVISNLPADMTWRRPRTNARERTLLVMAGGELLIDAVRETIFYPALRALREKYGARGPKIAIQTTGDVMTGQHVDEMLALGVETISIASIDDYHIGMEGERKFHFMEEVRKLMTSRGVREVSLGIEKEDRLKAPALDAPQADDGPTFLFFGALPELWIGELWPRGRAFANGLTEASYETNFCARWSGAKNFLAIGEAGSEVAIEPDGSVYPCCLKTRSPLGSLAEESLEEILASVAMLPAIAALNRGDPEAMGIETGWDREEFRRRSSAPDGKGRMVSNMCLGCDRYFEERLGAELAALRAQRLAEKQSGAAVRVSLTP